MPSEEGTSVPPGGNRNLATDDEESQRSRALPADWDEEPPRNSSADPLHPNSPLWNTYTEKSQKADKEMVDSLNGTLNVLLVFAGLFSAVVTTFVVQSLQALSPNYAQITASLVYEQTRMQRAIAEGTPVRDVPRSQLSYDSVTHSGFDVWVNGIWLTSLLLSLVTSMLSVLLKQCIQHFVSSPSDTFLDSAYVRQYRAWAFERWRVPAIIGFLPTLLIVALLLFFAGLAVSVGPMNATISYVVTGFTGVAFVAYFATLVLPFLFPHCAYQAPGHGYAAFLACIRLVMVILFTPFGMMLLPRTSRDSRAWFYATPDMGKHALHMSEVRDMERRRQFLTGEALAWLCRTTSNPSDIELAIQASRSHCKNLSEGQADAICRPAAYALDNLTQSPETWRKALRERSDTVSNLIITMLQHPGWALQASRSWRSSLDPEFPENSLLESPQLGGIFRILSLISLREPGSLNDRSILGLARCAVEMPLSTLRFPATLWRRFEYAIIFGIIWLRGSDLFDAPQRAFDPYFSWTRPMTCLASWIHLLYANMYRLQGTRTEKIKTLLRNEWTEIHFLNVAGVCQSVDRDDYWNTPFILTERANGSGGVLRFEDLHEDRAHNLERRIDELKVLLLHRLEPVESQHSPTGHTNERYYRQPLSWSQAQAIRDPMWSSIVHYWQAYKRALRRAMPGPRSQV